MAKDRSIKQLMNNVIEHTSKINKAAVRRNTMVQMVTSTVTFSFAILHLLLFIFNFRFRENLYYSLFLITNAIFSYLRFGEQSEPLVILRICFTILMFPTVLRFLYSLFYTQLPKQFWVLGCSITGVGVVSMFVSSPRVNFLFRLLVLLSL